MQKEYFGVYKGVVCNIKDPEKRGRIKVTCPEVLGATVESAWCDPCVPVAYDSGGDFCLPHIDETVWLMFQGGDSNKPVYFGGWWQKNKTPFSTAYSNVDKTRIISYGDCTITMSSGTIKINVGSGSGDLIIQDKKVIVQGDLVVQGNISMNNISNNEGSSGEARINSLYANSIDSGSVETTTLNSDTISVKGVTADEVTASGVKLSTHTHGSSSDEPNK